MSSSESSLHHSCTFPQSILSLLPIPSEPLALQEVLYNQGKILCIGITSNKDVAVYSADATMTRAFIDKHFPYCNMDRVLIPVRRLNMSSTSHFIGDLSETFVIGYEVEQAFNALFSNLIVGNTESSPYCSISNRFLHYKLITVTTTVDLVEFARSSKALLKPGLSFASAAQLLKTALDSLPIIVDEVLLGKNIAPTQEVPIYTF